jgi:hypothetical protein
MRDIRTIRYVTVHYPQLQGLRLVPLGVPFLLSAAWRTGWLQWWPAVRGRGATLWFVSLLVGAVALSFPIRRWYEWRFGTVATRGAESSLPLLTCVLLLVAAAAYQLRGGFAFSLPVLVTGIILTAIGVSRWNIRPHYVIVGVACGLYAFSRPLGVPISIEAVLFDLLVGSGLIVAGIGDHLALTRILIQSSEAHVRPL